MERLFKTFYVRGIKVEMSMFGVRIYSKSFEMTKTIITYLRKEGFEDDGQVLATV